jgi:mutual gliding-motility protein MglA
MSFINYVSKEINCKIVYFGTGLSGKTTNIQYIFEHTQGEEKSKLVSLSTENERTLFFDFLPLAVGDVKGFRTRFHLYSIPGQTFYELSREFILKGTDGIVFVVDSQAERMEENLESFNALEKSLERQGYDLHRLPLVIQYNKRDLPTALSIGELERAFNPARRPYVEATAHRGDGVMETLERVSEMVLRNLKRGEGA